MYPFNWSQILQYVRLIKKLTLQKKLQNYVTNNVFWGKNKLRQQQNKSNKKYIAEAGN